MMTWGSPSTMTNPKKGRHHHQYPPAIFAKLHESSQTSPYLWSVPTNNEILNLHLKITDLLLECSPISLLPLRLRTLTPTLAALLSPSPPKLSFQVGWEVLLIQVTTKGYLSLILLDPMEFNGRLWFSKQHEMMRFDSMHRWHLSPSFWRQLTCLVQMMHAGKDYQLSMHASKEVRNLLFCMYYDMTFWRLQGGAMTVVRDGMSFKTIGCKVIWLWQTTLCFHLRNFNSPNSRFRNPWQDTNLSCLTNQDGPSTPR